MKKTILIMALAALAVGPAFAQQQRATREGLSKMPRIEQGLGPVIRASATPAQLPAQAQAFIGNLFPDATVTDVEQNFAKGTWEVDLSDGYEVTFDNSGNWIEVEAPDGAMLSSDTLTALIPEEAVLTTIGSDALLNGGATEVVDEVTVTPEGYLVEYVTGTVGKGKANISKSDGSIILKARKGDKYSAKGQCDRKGGHGKAYKHARKAKGQMRPAMRGAQPVVLTPGK